MIRGVLFDMDGVLLDTERLGMELVPEIGRRLGYPYAREMYRMVLGVNAKTRVQIYREAFGEGFPMDRLEREFHQALTDLATMGALPLKKGLTECFQGLRARGIKTALATSTERPLVEFYRQCLPAFHGIFDATVCGMECPQGKPAPDIYEMAAQRLGLSPGECLGVEDSWNGVQSLRAAGCHCVMIPDLLPYGEAFTPYVDTTLSDLTELCPLIDSLNHTKQS